MKKTVTINIRGNVFHIEEDAYQKLSEYLEDLAQHFDGQEADQEILQDIESRVAELLQNKIQEGNEAITEEMVADVMNRMGSPKDFMDDEDSNSAKAEAKMPKIKAKKRLYRDGENRVLGGVCSGMSTYFNIDPVFLRILFVVLVFLGVGVSGFIYLILWVVVPKAKTTAQRLEMRGEEATIRNIKKSVQEEMTEVKKSFAENGGSEIVSQGKSVGIKVANGMGRFLAVLVGSLLIVTGFFGFIFFLISVVLGNTVLHTTISGIHPDVDVSGILGFMVSPGTVSLALLLLVLVIGIPLLVLLFAGTKMVFRYKTNNKAIGLGAFGIWLVALLSLAAVGVGQADNFKQKSSATISKILETPHVKTLYINVNTTSSDVDENTSKFNEFELIKQNNELVLAGHPEVKIESTSASDFSVVLSKQARGKNSADAQKNLSGIVYNFASKDSTLYLDRFFTLDNQEKWRKQELVVTVKVPVGKHVYIGKDLETMNLDINNLDNIWDKEMVGKTWEMTAEGLLLKK
ncbi:MAG TPA: PspC domain-containing protein [Prolixibacteraceae bacterium]|nr:PspC domain-containing protein [Prolixibacteraceae bacterium]